MLAVSGQVTRRLAVHVPRLVRMQLGTAGLAKSRIARSGSAIHVLLLSYFCRQFFSRPQKHPASMLPGQGGCPACQMDGVEAGYPFLLASGRHAGGAETLRRAFC